MWNGDGGLENGEWRMENGVYGQVVEEFGVYAFEVGEMREWG
ncbi:hypothetical protein [Echinicola arenosa]|nr:hypothetical protein [Echinicola arenosa]